MKVPGEVEANFKIIMSHILERNKDAVSPKVHRDTEEDGNDNGACF